jgi:hypothetical protein
MPTSQRPEGKRRQSQNENILGIFEIDYELKNLFKTMPNILAIVLDGY